MPAPAVLRAAWALLIAVAVGAGGPAPARAEAPGWRPVFAADFSGAALPSGCAAVDGSAGVRPGVSYRRQAVSVGDGVLRVGGGGGEAGAGGVWCTVATQSYGRYELRARAPLPNGVVSQLALAAVPAAPDDEILAEITGRPGAEELRVRNGYATGATVRSLPGIYCDTFHTYAIEWTPSGLRVLVDGVLRLTDPQVSARPKQLGFAVSPQPGVAAPPAVLQVDWLRVYGYQETGSAPRAAVAPADSSGPFRWVLLAAAVALVVAVVAALLARRRPRRWPPPEHRA